MGVLAAHSPFSMLDQTIDDLVNLELQLTTEDLVNSQSVGRGVQGSILIRSLGPLPDSAELSA